jgi:hypothetical protein
MTLPELASQRLYEFFDSYRLLTWSDKLIAYAAFEPDYPRFFDGDFAVSPAQYYAAVQAIVEFYGIWPREFLESRRAFFLFVHVAYHLALGRKPAGAHSVIVCAQHEWCNLMATYLVEDFSQAKFVHTIRDPISSCDSMFHFLLGSVDERVPRTYILAPYSALCCLTNKDRPHFRMESRTRTIRFEDLHSKTSDTMRDLADWLGLPYQPTLFDSTFNGVPYLNTQDGKTWSGRRLEQVERRSRHLSPKDRSLLFTLFYENFLDWDYPCPKIFGNPIIRFMVFASLFLLPMNTEIIAAQAVFKRRILPSLRHGNIWRAMMSLLAVGFCRLKLIGLLVPAFFERCAHPTTLLQIDRQQQPELPPTELPLGTVRPSGYHDSCDTT